MLGDVWMKKTGPCPGVLTVQREGERTPRGAFQCREQAAAGGTAGAAELTCRGSGRFHKEAGLC